MRTAFWNDLPKWENGTNKGRVNWVKSISHKVKFCYDEIINDEIIIVGYDGKYLTVKYKDYEDFKIQTSSFKKCIFGKLLKKYTDEFKVPIGKNLISEGNKKSLTIIDRKYIRDKDGCNRKYYKYKCNKCGFECGEHYRKGKYEQELWIDEYNLLKGIGCSCCRGVTIVEGINDIPTTDPWMVKYFQGGYDEAKKYTFCSNKSIKPICPYCGRIKDKAIKINNIYNNKSIGCNCSNDGFSFPEKVMMGVLKQLNTYSIAQANKSILKWCERYKYDFFVPSFNMIIETHGRGHYEEIERKGARTLKEERENDRIKKELALQNGIKEDNYIIINCRRSNLSWIKNNILNSELKDFFDLSKIDWNKVEKEALDNKIFEVCKIKKQNPNLSTLEIGKLVGLGRQTITNYLKIGTKFGWVTYDPNKERLLGYEKSKNTNRKKLSKKVEIFKHGKSLGIFNSCHELDSKSEQLFGVKLNYKQISNVCLGKYRHRSHKGFTFKYI